LSSSDICFFEDGGLDNLLALFYNTPSSLRRLLLGISFLVLRECLAEEDGSLSELLLLGVPFLLLRLVALIFFTSNLSEPLLRSLLKTLPPACRHAPFLSELRISP